MSGDFEIDRPLEPVWYSGYIVDRERNDVAHTKRYDNADDAIKAVKRLYRHHRKPNLHSRFHYHLGAKYFYVHNSYGGLVLKGDYV